MNEIMIKNKHNPGGSSPWIIKYHNIATSRTVESIHRDMIQKLSRLDILIKYISDIILANDDKSTFMQSPLIAMVDNIINTYEKINNEYRTSTVISIINYYNNLPNASNQYFEMLTTYNIQGKLTNCFKICNEFVQYYNNIGKHSANHDTHCKKLNTYIRDADAISINIPIKTINYGLCCETKMDSLSASSQLQCAICNKCMDIKGMVFEDAQFYSQEGNKTKHGVYNHMRNFIGWMEHVMARDNPKLSPNFHQLFSARLKDRKLGEPGKATKLTIKIVRDFLKEISMTKYNPNASFILATYSGKYPPQLDITEYNLIKIHYRGVIDIYNEDMESGNTPYCPYFIYKLVKVLWANDPEKMRLRNYIHLMKPDTVMKLDNKWMNICKKKGYIYEATDYTR